MEAYQEQQIYEQKIRMIQIELFIDRRSEPLKQKVNDFLKDIPKENIIDIKISQDLEVFSILVIYKVKL